MKQLHYNATRYDTIYFIVPVGKFVSDSDTANIYALTYTYHNNKKHNPVLRIPKYCTHLVVKHSKTIAHSLQSQAALLRSFTKLGTKEFLQCLSLQWGTCDGSVTVLFACLKTERLVVTIMAVCTRRVSLIFSCTTRLPYHVDIPYLTKPSHIAW